MKLLLKFCGSILLGTSIGCVSPPVSQQRSTNSDLLPSSPKENLEDRPKAPDKTGESPQNINNVFIKDDALSFGNYSVEKVNKKVQIEQTSGSSEVSYAVLKRGGKVLAKFDGISSGMGNATEFGLFSFLGNENKQLVVSQTIPRNGRHWIVDLSPDFRVIYDSADYAVGREDLSVLDIDKNGQYEILLEDTAFYGFEKLSMAGAPLPLIIFKYDEKAGKYLPANHLFKEYALENIKSITSENNLAKLLAVTLQYIYAGEEQTGWEFFDKEYKNPDREDIKSRAKAILRKEPVYKFIYGKGGPK